MFHASSSLRGCDVTVFQSIGPLRSPSWIVDITRSTDGCGGCSAKSMHHYQIKLPLVVLQAVPRSTFSYALCLLGVDVGDARLAWAVVICRDRTEQSPRSGGAGKSGATHLSKIRSRNQSGPLGQPVSNRFAQTGFPKFF